MLFEHYVAHQALGGKCFSHLSFSRFREMPEKSEEIFSSKNGEKADQHLTRADFYKHLP